MTEYYHTGSGGVWPSHHRDEEKDTGWDLRGHKTPWSCRSELEKKLGK
jgi:hypothetical protein